jgi:catechol 2,3-dioxygenase-like lactoylglutathione lyase family enzyme
VDYAKLLGRAPSWRGEHPGWGTANVLFRLDNTVLELIGASGDGPIGFALRTDDADALATALSGRGIAAAAPVAQQGRDVASGAVRHWRNVFLGDAGRGVVVFAIEHRSSPDALPWVAPDGSADAAISGIDHVVVRTEAPDAAIAFYGDQLGLRLALDKSFEQWGARLLFFRVGGVTVEIAAPLPAVATPSAADEFWGISWRTPDVAAAHARLAASGFEISELRPGRRPNTEVFTVRTPTHGVATLVIGGESGERGRS